MDLQARLENLEATADRVRSFLDQAATVEEALAVNQELSRLEGRSRPIRGASVPGKPRRLLDYYGQPTPDELAQPIEVGGWRLGGAAREAVEALLGRCRVWRVSSSGSSSSSCRWR